MPDDESLKRLIFTATFKKCQEEKTGQIVRSVETLDQRVELDQVKSLEFKQID